MARRKSLDQRNGAVAVADQADQEPIQGVTKAQAIAEAVRQLGKKASAQDLIGYARQKFGLEVTPQYVSVIKSGLKKRGRRGGAGRRQAAAAGLENGGALKRQPAATDTIRLILDVKELAQRAGGMKTLKRLVDALAE